MLLNLETKITQEEVEYDYKNYNFYPSGIFGIFFPCRPRGLSPLQLLQRERKP